jgi:CRISPR-associated protein Csd1
MILNSLYLFYNRLKEQNESGIALPGFVAMNVHFAIVFNDKGDLVAPKLKDLRDTQKNKKIPLSLKVPEGFNLNNEIVPRRTKNPAVKFLCDNSKYIFGIDDEDASICITDKSKNAFELFKEFHNRMKSYIDDKSYNALLKFINKWTPDRFRELPYKDDILKSNFVFQMDGENEFIHDKSAIKQGWINYRNSLLSDYFAQCLISGEKQPIARIHPSIKNVYNANTEAAIVSFNKDKPSFESYNKSQSYNAPISSFAAFAYTTALNHLLRRNSRQKIQIGDATTVFWTERESPVEDLLGYAVDPEDAAEDDQKKLKDILESLQQGKMPPEIDKNIGYYILGLSPNASRIAVRFWHVSTVGEILKRINEHFSDMKIVRNYPDSENEYPGIWRLIRETAVLKDTKNISPLLAGTFARSILSGEDYPRTILTTTLGRIKADGDVNYYRACLIKGYLNRYHRKRDLTWEVSMSLNVDLKDPGYLLGRLFSVLEKAQEEAINPNATIKDRYFGSASATPRAVFPQLLRNAGHHFAKLETGRKVNLEKLVQEIVDDLKMFPAHLSLEDQGMFALGYYQQRKDLFTAKAK